MKNSKRPHSFKKKKSGMFKRLMNSISTSARSGRAEADGKKVANFEAGSQKPVQSGYLWKKSHGLIRSRVPWKKRWFALYPDGTFVWSVSSDAKQNNSLKLTEEYEIKPLTGSTKDPFCWMIWETRTERRVMKLAADKQDDYMKWIERLGARCAGESMSTPMRNLMRKSSSKVMFTSELQQCADRADVKGFLKKLPVGRTEGKWHRRYFVLDGVRLLYFKVGEGSSSGADKGGSTKVDDDSIESTRCGLVVLNENSTVRAFDPEDGTKHCVQIETDSSMLIAALTSAKERSIWIDAISQIVADLADELRDDREATKRGILHFPKSDLVGRDGPWSRRFVVMQGGAMTLYKDETQTGLRDSFDLSNCSAIANSLKKGTRPKGAPPGGTFFKLENPAWQDMSRHVRVPTDALMWQWVTAIKYAADKRRTRASNIRLGSNDTARKLFSGRSFRSTVHFSGSDAGSPRAMPRVRQLMMDFFPPISPSSPKRPKASLTNAVHMMTPLDTIPEDSNATSPADDEGNVLSRSSPSLCLALDGHELAVRILAFAANPRSSIDSGHKTESLFDVYRRDHQELDDLVQVYVSVTFKGRRWIVCRSLQETCDFVEECASFRAEQTPTDAKTEGLSPLSSELSATSSFSSTCHDVSTRGRVRKTRPSVRSNQSVAFVDLEEQRDALGELRDTLTRCMSTNSSRESLALLYFLQLAPMPPVQQKNIEAVLLAEATGQASISQDVVTTVSNVSELFGPGSSSELGRGGDVVIEPLHASIHVSDDVADLDTVNLKVWCEIERSESNDDGDDNNSTRSTPASHKSIFHMIENVDMSSLLDMRSQMESLGLSVPSFPTATDLQSSDREARVMKMFGKGDLGARLIKMYFDEMPVRLLSPVQDQALALKDIAHLSEKEKDAECASFLEVVPEPNKSTLLWLLDLICDIAENEKETKMGHYGLGVVFAPNIVAVESNGDGDDPLKAQMAFNVAVRALEQLSMWRERRRMMSSKESNETKEESSSRLSVSSSPDRPISSIDRDEYGIALEQCTVTSVDGYGAKIPTILVRLRDILVKVGGLHKLGIFRISPGKDDVDRMRDLIASGEIFGGLVTRQRRLQQFIDTITKEYFGLDTVLDFFRVEKGLLRTRLKRLFWLSKAVSIRHIGERLTTSLHKCHQWEISFDKSAPSDVTNLTRGLAADMASMVFENAFTRATAKNVKPDFANQNDSRVFSPSISSLSSDFSSPYLEEKSVSKEKSTANTIDNTLEIHSWNVWNVVRPLLQSLRNSDQEKSDEQIELERLCVDEICGKKPLLPHFKDEKPPDIMKELCAAYKRAKKAFYRDKDNKSLKGEALAAKAAMLSTESRIVNFERTQLCVTLRLLAMLRLLSRQITACQDAREARDVSMRQREEELRQGKSAPNKMEITQFFMLHNNFLQKPWDWVTDKILLGVMPIKTTMDHAPKIIEECAKKANKSLGLVVSVMTEEEFVGVDMVVDPVNRVEWEENGVEHLRISLKEETYRHTPNVSKSKQKKATSWAAELSRATRKIKRCLDNGNCVYIHDTFDEVGDGWLLVMAFLTTYGNYGFDTAKAVVQRGRSKLKPTRQQEQMVNAFESYFESIRGLGKRA